MKSDLKKKNTNKKYNQSGFTTLELLVVISIIALLSSLLSVSVSQARKNSRDLKRVADLKQLQKAIETYNIDQKGYPDCYSGPVVQICGSPPGFRSGTSAPAPLHPLTGLDILAKGYVEKIPNDPTNILGASGFGYFYLRGYRRTTSAVCTNLGGTLIGSSQIICRTNNAKDYILATYLENTDSSFPDYFTPWLNITSGSATVSPVPANFVIGNLD